MQQRELLSQSLENQSSSPHSQLNARDLNKSHSGTRAYPPPGQTSKLYIWGTLYESLDANDDSLYSSANGCQNQSFHPDLLSQSQQRAKLISTFDKVSICNVSCGKNHTAIVTDRGDLYVMGSNDGGQLGIGEYSKSKYQEIPLQLTIFSYKSLRIEQVACGHSHSIALTQTGQVYSWGYGKFGALGLSHFDSRNAPTLVTFFSDFTTSAQVKQIQCGAHHSALLDNQGRLFMWGAGEVGQLGLGQRLNECAPKLVTNPQKQHFDVNLLACGYFHTVIQTHSGQIFQTGQFKNSQLQEYSIMTSFKEIESLRPNNIVSIKAKDYTAALNNEGHLIYWQSPKDVQILYCPLLVNDFELSKQFILVRKGVMFFKCDLETKRVEELTYIEQFEKKDLSLVACGHNYVIAVRTKRGNLSRSTCRLRQKNTEQQSLMKESRKRREESVENQQTPGTSLRIKNHARHEKQDSKSQGSLTRSLSREMMQRSQRTLRNTQNVIQNYEFGGTFSQQKDSKSALRQSNCHSQNRVHRKETFNQNPLNMTEQKCQNLFNLKIEENSAESPSQVKINESHFSNLEPTRVSQEENQFPTRNFNFQRLINTDLSEVNSTNYLKPQISQNSFQNYDQLKQNESLKLALTSEIERRQQLEIQIQTMQKEFDQFRKEVGIDQMKNILAESQNEYQKIYDICIKECEKSNRINEMYKKEKKLNEEREQKLYDIGEETQLLQNQIKYLEDQLQKEREERQLFINKFNQEREDKQTVVTRLNQEREDKQSYIIQLEQERKERQKVCQELEEKERLLIENENAFRQIKSDLEAEKQYAIEKSFDDQEQINSYKEEIEQLIIKISDLQEELQKQKRIEEENTELQLHEMQLKVQQKEQEVDLYKKATYKVDELQKEIDELRKTNEDLRQKVRDKNENLKEYDSIIQDMKTNESQLKIQVEKLDLQIKSKEHVAQKAHQQQHLAHNNHQQQVCSNEKKQPESYRMCCYNKREAQREALHLQQQRLQTPQKKSQVSSSRERTPQKPSEQRRGSTSGKRAKNRDLIQNSNRDSQNTSKDSSPMRLENLMAQQEMKNDIFSSQIEQLLNLKTKEKVIENLFEEQKQSQKQEQPVKQNNISNEKRSQSNEKDQSKKVKFMIGSKLVDDQKSEEHSDAPEQEQLQIKPSEIQDEEINRLYESIHTEMKSLQGQNVEDLKTKLETIRKNKLLLESRIKEYEKRLKR